MELKKKKKTKAKTLFKKILTDPNSVFYSAEKKLIKHF